MPTQMYLQAEHQLMEPGLVGPQGWRLRFLDNHPVTFSSTNQDKATHSVDYPTLPDLPIKPLPWKPSRSSGSLSMNCFFSLLGYRLFFFHYYYYFFLFLGLHLWQMEVPRPGVKSELQLLANATATAAPDPSLIFDLHPSSQQQQILNPLSEAKDQTRVLMDTSWVHYHWATIGTPKPPSYFTQTIIRASHLLLPQKPFFA